MLDVSYPIRPAALELPPPGSWWTQALIKRGFDIAASVCLLALTAPLIVLASILIRLTSSGAVLFRQERVGAGGVVFTIYKLRTMREDAEKESGPVLAAEDDPRVTWLGRFMRAARMDELPQLINVLKGDMSLVGPRPERPHFVSKYSERIPGYELRLSVRPGVSGLAQVCGRYSTSAERKLRYDLMYISNHSFFGDVWILLRTVLVILHPHYADGVPRDADVSNADSADL